MNERLILRQVFLHRVYASGFFLKNDVVTIIMLLYHKSFLNIFTRPLLRVEYILGTILQAWSNILSQYYQVQEEIKQCGC